MFIFMSDHIKYIKYIIENNDFNDEEKLKLIFNLKSIYQNIYDYIPDNWLNKDKCRKIIDIDNNFFKDSSNKNFIIKCLKKHLFNDLIVKYYYFDIILTTNYFFYIEHPSTNYTDHKNIFNKIINLPFKKNQINILIFQLFKNHSNEHFNFLYENWLNYDENIIFFFKYISKNSSIFNYLFTNFPNFIEYSINNNLVDETNFNFVIYNSFKYNLDINFYNFMEIILYYFFEDAKVSLDTCYYYLDKGSIINRLHKLLKKIFNENKLLKEKLLKYEMNDQIDKLEKLFNEI